MPELREVGGHAVDQRMQVDVARLFPLHVLAYEGERVVGHPLHLVERGKDPGPRLRVLDELGVQAQARDRGPEVVRDCRQHGRAVTDEAVEARAHEVERAHRVAGFHRPGLGQVVHRRAPAEPPGRRREAAHGLRDPACAQDRHYGDGERREEEAQHEGPAPGRRAGRRPHRHVQPAPVRKRHRRREPVGFPGVVAVIVVVPLVVVVIVVVIVVIALVVPIIVVQVACPERRHADQLRLRAKRGGEASGDRGGPLAGARLDHDGLTGQRETRELRARRRDDGVVQVCRGVPQEPRHRRCAQDRIVPVRMAHRLHALPGEQRHGDSLRGGEREQQQQRELAREASRREPHARSTSPANR